MKTMPTTFDQIPHPLPPPPPPPPSAIGLVPVGRSHRPGLGLALGALAMLNSLWFVVVDTAPAVYGVLGTLTTAIPGVVLAWRAGEGTGDDHDRRAANLSGAGVALGIVAVVIVVIELTLRD